MPEENAMTALAAVRAPAPFARAGVRPTCPVCKDELFAATVSVHVHDDHIRNWWSCDRCGHQFMTCVSVLCPEPPRLQVA